MHQARAHILASVIMALCFFASHATAADELPEVLGLYLKPHAGKLVEMKKQRTLYSTRWYDKQSVSTEKDSEQGAGTTSKRKISDEQVFVVKMTGPTAPLGEIQGFILYTVLGLGDTELFRLSDGVLPLDAGFMQYHGPRPIEPTKMWFLADELELKATSLQDEMFHLEPRESLAPGCYAIWSESGVFDFAVSSEGSKWRPGLVGQWTGTFTMSRSSGDIISGLTMEIEAVDRDGKIRGSHFSHKIETGDRLGPPESLGLDSSVDWQERTVRSKDPEDTAETGSIRGEWILDLVYSERCGGSVVYLRGVFEPYSQYRTFLKERGLGEMTVELRQDR